MEKTNHAEWTEKSLQLFVQWRGVDISPDIMAGIVRASAAEEEMRLFPQRQT